MKDFLQINDESNSTCLNSYQTIAKKLMNDYKLQVRDKFYRIIECEFYYNSEKHLDPYVHGHKRQKETIGEWYFHGSGLDITLGSENGYGGILIRGIAEVVRDSPIPERKEAILGPLNVVSEIFTQIGDSRAEKSLDFGLVDISRERRGANMKTARVFSIPRIGLNLSKDTVENFHNRAYRFITFLHLPHKNADKVKKYLTESTQEPLTLEDYKLYYKGVKW